MINEDQPCAGVSVNGADPACCEVHMLPWGHSAPVTPSDPNVVAMALLANTYGERIPDAEQVVTTVPIEDRIDDVISEYWEYHDAARWRPDEGAVEDDYDDDGPVYSDAVLGWLSDIHPVNVSPDSVTSATLNNGTLSTLYWRRSRDGAPGHRVIMDEAANIGATVDTETGWVSLDVNGRVAIEMFNHTVENLEHAARNLAEGFRRASEAASQVALSWRGALPACDAVTFADDAVTFARPNESVFHQPWQWAVTPQQPRAGVAAQRSPYEPHRKRSRHA